MQNSDLIMTSWNSYLLERILAVWIFSSYLCIILFYLLFLVLSDCGDPSKPDNAVVITGNHWAGEYVRYLCNPGYTMVGPAVRRCLPSGKWSGYAPKCESSNIRVLSEKLFFVFFFSYFFKYKIFAWGKISMLRPQ